MDLRKLSRVQDSGNKTKFTEEERKKLAKEGLALPDGSFPIRNKQDLKDAIKAIGLARSYNKTKKWIIKRARELNAIDELPESWRVKDSHEKRAASVYELNGKTGKLKHKKDIVIDELGMYTHWDDTSELEKAFKEGKTMEVIIGAYEGALEEEEESLEELRKKVQAKVKDSSEKSLDDKDVDIEIGMRVYEKLASGNKAYGKVIGVNYHAGTVNIEGEEYDDSYDVPWEEVFVA